MPRICTVCRHEERKAIEQSLVHREPIRAIATRFDVSRSALQRHSKHHLPQALAKACEAREIEIGGELLEDLEQLTEDNLSIRSQALDSGDLRTALMANREIRANYELLAKVTGKIKGPEAQGFQHPVFILPEGTKVSLEVDTGPDHIDVRAE